MKSPRVERLFRFLIVLLGVGAGVSLVIIARDLYLSVHPGISLRTWWLGIGYVGMGCLGGLLFFALSGSIMNRWQHFAHDVDRHFDKMPISQVLPAIIGLILGLIVAALLSQIMNFLGNGMFPTVMSALLYLVFGALGYRTGKRRSREMMGLITARAGSAKHTGKRHVQALPGKLIDTSALIDGRILSVGKTGFLEGELVVPLFVADELRHVADSSDPVKRERGRRGMEILNTMQEELGSRVRTDETDYPEIADVDVRLLRLARDTGRTIVTCDHNLARSAQVNSVTVLNINELSDALRPAVTQGQELSVRIAREGKENNQGLAYLEDGTMMVVEGGRQKIGQQVTVTVTSVLQTSAGRMVFARLRE